MPFFSILSNGHGNNLDCYLIFTNISSEHDRQNRFVFVVDMRNGATGNILKSLLKTLEVLSRSSSFMFFSFQEEFKNLTAVVFVVKPEKFWEKHKASVTSGKYSFDVQTVQLDQLTKTIDLGQIIREVVLFLKNCLFFCLVWRPASAQSSGMDRNSKGTYLELLVFQNHPDLRRTPFEYSVFRPSKTSDYAAVKWSVSTKTIVKRSEIVYYQLI